MADLVLGTLEFARGQLWLDFRPYSIIALRQRPRSNQRWTWRAAICNPGWSWRAANSDPRWDWRAANSNPRWHSPLASWGLEACDFVLDLFWMGPEQIQNRSRTNPEQRRNTVKYNIIPQPLDPEQIQNKSRTNPEQQKTL